MRWALEVGTSVRTHILRRGLAMKVLNLSCAEGHRFEGWFGGEDDFLQQNGSSQIECPLCGDRVITRIPAAPRLNLSKARGPLPPEAAIPSARVRDARSEGSIGAPDLATAHPSAASADQQAAWLSGLRRLIQATEDVGTRFAEEARRIHYGEVEHRGIRGQATPDEREALRDEGIETVSIPIPKALQGPLQ